MKRFRHTRASILFVVACSPLVSLFACGPSTSVTPADAEAPVPDAGPDSETVVDSGHLSETSVGDAQIDGGEASDSGGVSEAPVSDAQIDGATDSGGRRDAEGDSAADSGDASSLDSSASAISVGSYSACALLSGGSVTCWGANDWGELGSGTSSSSSTPVTVSGLSHATAVSAGALSACALLTGGSVDCWGDNENGELGNGTTGLSSTPVTVTGLSDATAMSAGDEFACALLSGGSVDCWGDNENGELGNGTSGVATDSSTPVIVTGISDATAISAGYDFACALLSSGSVACWGDNEFGELGNGTTTGPGTCLSGAPCATTPVAVSGITNATAISAGYDFACALLSGGSVACWGDNGAGELGNGTTSSSSTPVTVTGLSHATAISAGYRFACALLSGGSVVCWGLNAEGELGNGTSMNFSSTPVTVSGVSDATAISAGYDFACALLSGGSVACWGDNGDGELGNGTTSGPESCNGNPCSTTPVEVIGF